MIKGFLYDIKQSNKIFININGLLEHNNTT